MIFDCHGLLVDSETIGGGVLIDIANSLGASQEIDSTAKLFKCKIF